MLPLPEERIELTNRMDLYKNRLATAKKNLIDDIQNWTGKVNVGGIDHHVVQMKNICDFVYGCMFPEDRADATEGESIEPDGKEIEGVIDEHLINEALVTAVLTSQWLLWREVMQQHFPGLPHASGLRRLNKFTARRYFSLLRALPQSARQKMSVHPPVVHLGAMSALSVVAGGPNVVNVPFGVIFDEEIQYAISHEVGHIFINSNPQILEEIKAHLRTKFTGESERAKIIQKKILGWLEEILADLIGVSMDGVNFANSGMWVMSSARSRIGTTDEEHPESTIRPYIYDKAIKKMEDHLLEALIPGGFNGSGHPIKDKLKALDDMDLDQIKAVIKQIKSGAVTEADALAETRSAEMVSHPIGSGNQPLDEYYKGKASFLGKLKDASGEVTLGNKLQSNESLFFPTLKVVKDEMVNILDEILSCKPATLANSENEYTVLEFLIKIFDEMNNNPDESFEWFTANGYQEDVTVALGIDSMDESLQKQFDWGTKPLEDCEDFVFSLPERMRLEHGTPSLYDDILNLCCWIGLGFCC